MLSVQVHFYTHTTFSFELEHDILVLIKDVTIILISDKNMRDTIIILMVIWTTKSTSRVLILVSSFEKDEYGWPSILIFDRFIRNLYTLQEDTAASIPAKIMVVIFVNTNNFVFNTDGDFAQSVPSNPHTQNMIPHQIPCP